MSAPKFSIISACHNHANYIKDYVKSILKQSYRPLEVVFVEDHSKDQSMGNIRHWRSQMLAAGIDLKIIRNIKRQYCATSYHRALQGCSGQYIGVLDTDDMLMPGAVEEIVSIYEKYPKIGWIYTQFSINDFYMKYKKKGFCLSPPKGWSLLDLGKRRKHAYSHWRTFSRRVGGELESIFKDGSRCAVDKYMGYRLEELSPGMFYDKILYKYRQGAPNGISRVENTKAVWAQIMREATSRRALGRLKIYPVIRVNE